MPIPDEQAGPKEPPADPLGELFEKVSKIANAAMAKEITADEWEKQIKEAIGEA